MKAGPPPGKIALIMIGGSLGGRHACEAILEVLPADYPVPIAIVLHRLAHESDPTLTRLLGQHTALPVTEVEDKVAIEAGNMYLAPADYHLLVGKGVFALSTGERVGHAAVDVLLESGAAAYRERAIGIVLRGTGADGANGLAHVKARGGMAIVQDPEDAETRQMPEAAIAKAQVDHVLPLKGIAAFLLEVA